MRLTDDEKLEYQLNKNFLLRISKNMGTILLSAMTNEQEAATREATVQGDGMRLLIALKAACSNLSEDDIRAIREDYDLTIATGLLASSTGVVNEASFDAYATEIEVRATALSLATYDGAPSNSMQRSF